MTQLESVTAMTYEIVEEARKRLNMIRIDPQQQILGQLRGESNQRLTCPLCLYEKNKSAIIRDGFFKCFACGGKGRINL